MKGQIFKGILLLCLLLPFLSGSAQTRLLDTKVSIQVVNTSLQQTLFLLSEEGNFSFAYNSDLIPVDSLISYTAEDLTVSQVLNELLGGRVSYKAVGNHIILQPVEAGQDQNPMFAVTGQVLNAETGEALEDVSIYSNVKLRSDVTDNSGSYNLELKKRKPKQIITVSKVGYLDTTLIVDRGEIYNLNIRLTPNPVAIDTTEKVEKFRLVNFFTTRKQRVNAFNIQDSLYRFWQFSFVPIIGTNYKMSGAITNNLSVNFIGGYNGGLRGLELGLGFNIIRNEVVGAQLAVLGNTAGGDVTGVQMSGFYNLNLQNMKGFQASGFVNVQRKSFKGVQASAGVNYADSLRGLQMSLVNVVRKETQGVQIGLANYTKGLKGFQLGIINISDTAKGTPIGMLSIVRKGYWHFDVYGDELTYLNLSIRTGVSYFHNIITTGFTWDGNNTLWRLGYGLGTEYSLGKNKRGFTNVDLTVSYINRGKDLIEDLNLLTTLSWDFGIRFKDHVGLFFGPTLKVYTSQYLNPETGQLGLENLAWHSQYRRIDSGVLNDLWVGVRGGIRF